MSHDTAICEGKNLHVTTPGGGTWSAGYALLRLLISAVIVRYMAYFLVQSSRSVSTVDNSISLIECSLVIVLISGSAPCLSLHSGKGAMVGAFDVVRRGPKVLDNLSLHFNVVRVIL